MAEKFRAIVTYQFKKGMQEQGFEFLQKNLTDHAKEFGCHEIEFLIDERNPQHVIGTGLWHSVAEAKNFQSKWTNIEKELIEFCSRPPERKIYKVEVHWSEKSKKAA
jgi:quinol monooxygenase YgiN